MPSVVITRAASISAPQLSASTSIFPIVKLAWTPPRCARHKFSETARVRNRSTHGSALV